MLNKDTRNMAEFSKDITKAVQVTIKQYENTASDHPLVVSKDKLAFMGDCFTGLISLAKGDISGIKPLAIKLGGFPDVVDKVEDFIMILKNNKDGINAKAAASTAVDGLSAMAVHMGLNSKVAGVANELVKDAIEDPS